MKENYLFTSESVTEGHPDKMCDQIADAVLDGFLVQDPFSHVIAECAVANGVIFIASRFESQARVDIPQIARQVIGQIGYEDDHFNAKSCTVMNSFTDLPAIASPRWDERDMDDPQIERITAKDHANVFGYACRQTPAMLPLPIWLAHRLARRVASHEVRKDLPYLALDAKTQVGIEFRNRRPYRIHSLTLVASQKRRSHPSPQQLRQDLIDHVISHVFRDEEFRPDERTHIFINPEGPVITGGPALHAGLTGRKNAIDTYGEYSRHSGAALSGKDPTRIDRVGAYAARYVAKNIVAAGLAEECEVQLSYSIGLARPVSIMVETFGTGIRHGAEIAAQLEACFDLRPAGILRQFNLRFLPQQRKGFYRPLAAYGHLGRPELNLPWEAVDKVSRLHELFP